MRRSALVFATAFVLATVGCSSDADPLEPPDAETDAGDAGSDGSTDTASPDTGDSATDTAPDAETGPACGNGVLDDGEACDDGNTKDGDGCSAKCENEATGPDDACPGVVVPLTGTGGAPRKGSVTGDTSAAKATYDHTCGGGAGSDVVYSFTPDVAGRATVTVDATYAALLAVRSACGEKTSEIACQSLSTTSGKITKSFPVVAGTPYFLHVDGAGGAGGAFTMDVEVTTAFCGNGLAELPEQCDDGNTTAGDGCSPTCELETLGEISTCPGLGYAFKGNTTVSFSGDTSLLGGTSTSTFRCSSASAKNAVYAITPDKTGSLELELRASYANAMLHVRRECFTASYEVDCTPAVATPATPIKLAIPARAGESIFVFVDGKGSGDVGPYALDAKLTPSSCANGVLDGDEQCDDGNTTAGDGCDPTCKVEAGGDTCATAPVLAPVLGSDGVHRVKYSGNTTGMSHDFQSCPSTSSIVAPDAVYTVTAPVDGYMTARLNRSSYVSFELRKSCTSSTGAVCRNSADGLQPEEIAQPVLAGEQYWFVVDGKNNDTSAVGAYQLDLAFTAQVCGNGVIEGTEACDDGNTLAGDGCAADCTLEPVTGGDTCTTAFDFALTESSGTWSGSVTSGTTNLTSKHTSGFPCGATTGKDIFYKVTAPIDGVLVAKVDSASFDVTLNARPGCSPLSGTSSNFITCSNVTSGLGGERVAFPVVAGTSYYVIVDGTSNGQKGQGRFTLDVSVQPTTCGDGVVTGSEACDDGNTVAGDGCSATCTVEPLTAFDVCPGHEVALTGTGTDVRRKVITVSTATMAANYAGTCGGSARDGVLKVTSDVSGELRAQMSGDFVSVLHARSTCADVATELACNTDTTATKVREIVQPISAGVPIYLFVDGISGQAGTGKLTLTVAP